MTEPGLSDYALIGNSRAAALVSKHGSIDWCCLPEFDSPALFCALMDRQKGGYFAISPADKYQSTQNYIPETNVVETVFAANDGEVRLTDAFTAMSEERKAESLFPDHEILRMVEGISGSVKMKLAYAPVIFYGKNLPFLEDRKKLGVHFSWKAHIYILLSTLEPEAVHLTDDRSRASAEFLIAPGERVVFSLAYSSQSPAVVPEIKTGGAKRIHDTGKYWRNWIGRCQYSGFYEEHVKRSALALKLLTHAPSGSIIAAPTTSLPEKKGADKNWDYRYCWLRDASFTTRALVNLGFEEETHAYLNWILHATQLTRPELQVVYSVYGSASIPEKTLDWLSGYKNSKPVRIGNGADSQFQLDVYGEVLDAVFTYSPLVKEFDRDSIKFLLGLGKVICKIWNRPDKGIWEVRSAPVHHTHSKVMAWAGLDRLIKLCLKYDWKNAPLEKFQNTAAQIHEAIEQNGYSHALDAYTRELNGNDLDASLLTLPLVQFCRTDSSRMVSTIRQIQERLSKNGLIYRYADSKRRLEEEGSFAVCNFWLVENLARSGDTEKAVKLFEKVLQYASPAGLLSEEIDPGSLELLGNYPQAFTHIGLINAALAINETYKKEAQKR